MDPRLPRFTVQKRFNRYVAYIMLGFILLCMIAAISVLPQG